MWRIGIFEGGHSCLFAKTIVGVFHRISGSINSSDFACRVVGSIGNNSTRSCNFGLPSHNIILKTGSLTIDGLSKNVSVIIISCGRGIYCRSAKSFNSAGLTVELIVIIGNQIAIRAIRIDLLNGNNFAIIGVGDNFCSIRIGDSLPDVAATQSFQFGMGGQTVQIGLPVFKTVNTLFLYGNHGTVCSLTAGLCGN